MERMRKPEVGHSELRVKGLTFRIPGAKHSPLERSKGHTAMTSNSGRPHRYGAADGLQYKGTRYTNTTRTSRARGGGERVASAPYLYGETCRSRWTMDASSRCNSSSVTPQPRFTLLFTKSALESGLTGEDYLQLPRVYSCFVEATALREIVWCIQHAWCVRVLAHYSRAFTVGEGTLASHTAVSMESDRRIFANPMIFRVE